MRLTEVEAREGARYCGIDIPTLLQRLEAFAAGGPWPSLHH